ncbi:MAG: hypothetical protein U5K27_18560 [Desulfotignum sp.]|nr:hypothetical protein [Desulfotignum sp.]
MNTKAKAETDVKVQLINRDGNAFVSVLKALRKAGYDTDLEKY